MNTRTRTVANPSEQRSRHLRADLVSRVVLALVVLFTTLTGCEPGRGVERANPDAGWAIQYTAIDASTSRAPEYTTAAADCPGGMIGATCRCYSECFRKKRGHAPDPQTDPIDGGCGVCCIGLTPIIAPICVIAGRSAETASIEETPLSLQLREYAVEQGSTEDIAVDPVLVEDVRAELRAMGLPEVAVQVPGVPTNFKDLCKEAVKRTCKALCNGVACEAQNACKATCEAGLGRACGQTNPDTLVTVCKAACDEHVPEGAPRAACKATCSLLGQALKGNINPGRLLCDLAIDSMADACLAAGAGWDPTGGLGNGAICGDSQRARDAGLSGDCNTCCSQYCQGNQTCLVPCINRVCTGVGLRSATLTLAPLGAPAEALRAIDACGGGRCGALEDSKDDGVSCATNELLFSIVAEDRVQFGGSGVATE